MTSYGPTEGLEMGRDVTGWLRVSVMDTPVPFLLQLVTASQAGAGEPSVSLMAGDVAPVHCVCITKEIDASAAQTYGFSYEAQDNWRVGILPC